MSTKTDMAFILLNALDKTPRQSPAMLAKKTGLGHQKVKTTLRTLVELELTETLGRGVYVLTEKGRGHLQNLQDSRGIEQ